jgi:hypothetical protein
MNSSPGSMSILESAADTPAQRSAVRPRLEPIVVGVILLVGVMLRTMQYLGRNSFWFDELAIALNIEQRSLAVLVSQPLDLRQVAPVGFMAAVKIGSQLLGVTELGLRVVPWLSGIAGLFLFWRVSIRILAGAPLLAALVLFSVSPSLVWYGNNVKPYAGDVTATLLLVLFALRLGERPHDRRAALTAGLIGGGALFFSFPAVVTAAVLGGILLWWWLRQRPHGSPAPLLALLIPWAIAAAAAGIIALSLKDAEGDAYMRRFWADDFLPAPWRSASAFLWIPDRLVSILGFQLLFIAREWTVGMIFVGICAALACLGLFDLFRKSPWKAALIAAPTIAAVLAATVRLLPFGLRVSLYAGWPLQLFAMAGLQALQRAVPARARPALVVLAALIAAIPAVLVGAHLPPYHSQESRPVLAELASRWRPGDVLYVYSSGEYAARFYGPRLGLTEWVTGGCHREEPRAHFRELDQFRGRPRVWFFYTHAALGFREPEVIRSYLGTVGKELDRIPDPFGARGQIEAAAYLYDLSDPIRLAAATWDTHQFPDPVTGEPRDLCDGRRVAGK